VVGQRGRQHGQAARRGNGPSSVENGRAPVRTQATKPRARTKPIRWVEFDCSRFVNFPGIAEPGQSSFASASTVSGPCSRESCLASSTESGSPIRSRWRFCGTPMWLVSTLT